MFNGEYLKGGQKSPNDDRYINEAEGMEYFYQNGVLTVTQMDTGAQITIHAPELAQPSGMTGGVAEFSALGIRLTAEEAVAAVIYDGLLIEGGEGDDQYLAGGYGNDRLLGHGGNDFMDGYDGNNWLDGGDGDDTLLSYDGSDLMEGGSGRDFLAGYDGEDTLYGGADGDLVAGSLGYGGGGADWLHGGSGDDRLYGYEGNDYLSGGDVLMGGAGADSLYGGTDDDILDGGEDNDKLWGEAGNDWLLAGGGNKTFHNRRLKYRIKSDSFRKITPIRPDCTGYAAQTRHHATPRIRLSQARRIRLFYADHAFYSIPEAHRLAPECAHVIQQVFSLPFAAA